MVIRLLPPGLCALLLASTCYGQAVKTMPYNAQLRTDPAVGNIQGIQRYGRPLMTDPDEGEGFSYHVHPTLNDPAGAQPNNDVRDRLLALAIDPEIQRLKCEVELARQKLMEAREKKIAPAEVQKLETALANLEKKLRDREAQTFAATGARYASAPAAPSSPYPPPFNATDGLRRPYSALSMPGVVSPEDLGFYNDSPSKDCPCPRPDVHHEPLIQVKVRVIEVNRSHLLNVSSVLDFIRQQGSSSITGNSLLPSMAGGIAGGTRFIIPTGIIDFDSTTSKLKASTGGALVNLKSGNLNYIARLLSEEFHADIITAPEVVTLNGQTVEFVSGQKAPFELGQNVIDASTNNIQQFFYKHVGTYISVQPQIVNWGIATAPKPEGHSGQVVHDPGEKAGKAPLMESEITDWTRFLCWLESLSKNSTISISRELVTKIHNYCGTPQAIVTYEDRKAIVAALGSYPREDLIRHGLREAGCLADHACSNSDCHWHAEDCTIDVALVVRLSDLGTVTFSETPPSITSMTNNAAPMTGETNVRGIADVVQVKSGHGVIIGGLIGERDIKDIAKVPVLGDIPGIGFLFRSKTVNRQKTEVLIFVEAQVLDPCPDAARVESANDFKLGQPYLSQELLDNPLDYGMYRAGFGNYLPPASNQERIYWERLGRKVRRMATTIDDALE